MTTTTKRADELKVGDVFVAASSSRNPLTATESPVPSRMLYGYLLVHSTTTLPNAAFAGRGDKNEFRSEMQIYTAVLRRDEPVEVLTP